LLLERTHLDAQDLGEGLNPLVHVALVEEVGVEADLKKLNEVNLLSERSGKLCSLDTGSEFASGTHQKMQGSVPPKSRERVWT